MPAVSTISNASPSISITMLMGSRVVPGTSDTRTRSWPASLFSSVDLPTLGRPMIARRGSAGFSSASPRSGSCSTRASRKSPVPRPCRALIICGCPRPSFHKWSRSSSCLGLSTLLAQNTKGVPARNRSRATAMSSSVTSLVASATNTTTSAPPMAISACSRMPRVSSSSGLNSHPPVSINRKSRPIHSASNSRRSRVTPGCSSTTAAFRRRMRLTRVDFPTFGLPSTATTGISFMMSLPPAIRPPSPPQAPRGHRGRRPRR
jgi:hypothetical protein